MAHPSPIFDGHNDMLLRIGDNPERFLKGDGEGHLDLPRARQGGLGGGFCAVFVRSPDEEDRMAPLEPDYALRQAARTAGRLFSLERASEGQVKVVRDADQLETALENGTFAAIFHMEGAEAIGPELGELELFYQAGLRSLGPVWSRPNIFAQGVPFGSGSPDTGPGLTAAGERLVTACNQLGIMIDLSHLNERGFWDVARNSDAPLVATHSNAHAISPQTRNLTDKQLDAIAQSDGMVGLNFAVYFLRPDSDMQDREADASLELMVRHIDHLIERLGIDRVGFGSDFDGAHVPAAIGDVAGLPALIQALRNAGYDEDAIAKLTHQNWLRVLRKTWKCDGQCETRNKPRKTQNSRLPDRRG
ncbi:MAG: dipeptidase [Chloroflexota bacterium]